MREDTHLDEGWPHAARADQPQAASLTITELAARTGTSARTIRYYAGLGLIPPPQVRGRLGYYGPEHVARLELVRELQSLGFTLAAIEGYLARIPADRRPEDLGLHRALLAPWLPEEPEEVDRSELDRRASRTLGDEAVRRLAALGSLERLGPDRILVTSRDALRLGLDVLEIEMPFEVLLSAKQIVDRHTGAMADELSGLFRESVLRSYRESGRPPRERQRLRSVLSRLKPITVQGVITGFQLAVNRAIRGSVPGGPAPGEAASSGTAPADADTGRGGQPRQASGS